MSLFGTQLFGGGGSGFTPGRNVSLPGDPSTHGGTITSHNQDGTVNTNGSIIVVQGASHSCPIEGHGVTSITAIVEKSYINGKLIITTGARAGCGAVINSPNRKLYIE